MSWLARLKNQNGPETHPTETTKTVSVVSVGTPQGHIQKIEGAAPTAANDIEPDPDRDCWPHSSAMNTGEIDIMVSRVELFVGRGVPLIEATAIADSLVKRDREGDDRRVCLECAHLSGVGAGRRCSAWRAAGIGGPAVSLDILPQLQRCGGFSDSNQRRTAP